MIQLRAPFSGETRELIWHATLTVHYGDSLAIDCTLVVYSFLRCIVGLWGVHTRTSTMDTTRFKPFKMAVPSNSALFESIGGDFGYSLCLLLKCSHGKNYRALDCVFFGYFYNVPQPPKVYIGK